MNETRNVESFTFSTRKRGTPDRHGQLIGSCIADVVRCIPEMRCFQPGMKFNGKRNPSKSSVRCSWMNECRCAAVLCSPFLVNGYSHQSISFIFQLPTRQGKFPGIFICTQLAFGFCFFSIAMEVQVMSRSPYSSLRNSPPLTLLP